MQEFSQEQICIFVGFMLGVVSSILCYYMSLNLFRKKAKMPESNPIVTNDYAEDIGNITDNSICKEDKVHDLIHETFQIDYDNLNAFYSVALITDKRTHCEYMFFGNRTGGATITKLEDATRNRCKI